MLSRIITITFLLFTVQFYYSCDPHDCGGYREYYVEFIDVEVSGWSFNSIDYYDQHDSVNRSNDVLVLDLKFKPDYVASPTAQSQSGGFSVANATEDCAYSELMIVDPIDSLVIKVIDQVSGEAFNVSDNFLVEIIDGQVYIDNWLLENHFYYDYLETSLQTDDFSDIPDSSFFEVEVYLNSGKVLESSTGILKFY
ncbi:MAG: hypothetical protein OCD76_13070 [Reichenbachiella sp.]